MREIEGWLTLSNAAARLGMPRNRVRKLEAAGVLHPRRDFLGKRRYDPGELDAAKGRSDHARPAAPARPRGGVDGARAARAFRLFGAGKATREVVLELEIHPDDVLDLRRKYAAMGSDFLVGAGELEQLRELLDWQGHTAATLVAAVNSRLRRQYDRGRSAGLTERDEGHHHSEQGSKVNGDGKEIHTGG